MFNEPKKLEISVEVARRLPTVNCEVVAIKPVPAEFEARIEFAAKAAELVQPMATVHGSALTPSVPFEPEVLTKPLVVKLDKVAMF